MRHILILASVLLFAGCGATRHYLVDGDVAPPQTKDTSAATENLIAQRVEAATKGEKAKTAALEKALDDQNKAEINGELRWLIALGVLIAAVGAGMAYYLGPKIGGGVALIGGCMVGGAMFVTSIIPYMGWIALGGGSIALIAAAYHFRKYFSALSHTLHGTEHLASASVKTLIGKIRARGPGYLTQFKSLLHHHSATVMGNVPVVVQAPKV